MNNRRKILVIGLLCIVGALVGVTGFYLRDVLSSYSYSTPISPEEEWKLYESSRRVASIVTAITIIVIGVIGVIIALYISRGGEKRASSEKQESAKAVSNVTEEFGEVDRAQHLDLTKDTELSSLKAGNKKFGVPPQDKSWIFLSYRRADSAYVAGRIYDGLIKAFGDHSVFRDVDSIPPGLDFRNTLDQVISQSKIFIAIIGPDWAGQIPGQNERRVDDPLDFVRVEVSSALERGIPVIPLLVEGAKMPNESELPEGLKPLAYRNGTVVRPDPDFHHDINRVISGIIKLQNLPGNNPV